MTKRATPHPLRDPIDPHHWRLHITSFWVLVGIGLLLLIASIVCITCFPYGPYIKTRWVQINEDFLPTWAPEPPPKSNRDRRVRFREAGADQAQ